MSRKQSRIEELPEGYHYFIGSTVWIDAKNADNILTTRAAALKMDLEGNVYGVIHGNDTKDVIKRIKVKHNIEDSDFIDRISDILK